MSKFTCVNVGVLLHVRLLMKPFTAILAGVGTGVRVNEQMRGQRGRALERFATLATAEPEITN